jgi:hypothetical protein
MAAPLLSSLSPVLSLVLSPVLSPALTSLSHPPERGSRSLLTGRSQQPNTGQMSATRQVSPTGQVSAQRLNAARATSARLLSALSLSVVLGSLALCSNAEALPPRSKQLRQTSTLQLDQESPWLSGWTLEGDAIGLRDLLDRKRRGYAVAFTTLECQRCEDGLRLLLSAQDQLAQEDIQIVVIFSGDVRAEDVSSWLMSRGLGGGSADERWRARRPVILIDRYFVTAERVGARDHLPLSFVLGERGHLLRLIAQEGYDLIDIITSAVQGQASIKEETQPKSSTSRRAR